jgi:CheY-like chemotaxis protein
MRPVSKLRPLRILVVDDDRDTVSTMAVILRLSGVAVVTASGGDEALALSRLCCPDAILLDVAMPGTDGWELARQIRRDPALKATYLVCVTGLGSDSDRQQSTDAGCDEHWVKPMDPGQLDTLLEWLGRKRDRVREQLQ